MRWRLRGLAARGLLGALAAMVATILTAAIARAAGVDLEVSGSSEPVPLSGIGVVTGFFSVVGTVIAVALRRWSSRPSERFVWTTASLTVVSFVPPLLWAADVAATAALIGLHLVAAAVMIPTLTRSLRT